MFLTDNFVITNIELANIVCDMENLLTLWWLMHRGKLTDIVCTVENWLISWFSMYRGKLRVTVWFVNTFCVMLLVTVWFVNRHSVWCFGSPCDSSTDILCDASGHRVIRQQTFCVMWKASGHRVIRQQTFCVMWKASGHRVIPQQTFVYHGKLTDIIVFHVPWKTDWHYTFRKHDIDIMCIVENLLISSWFMYR